MNRLRHHLPLALVASATAIGMSLVLSAWAQTPSINCYNYNNQQSCGAEGDNCVQTQIVSGNYCKQLSVPYSDPGCCSYYRVDITWTSGIGSPPCPCANQTTTDITSASNNPDLICFGGSDTSTTQAPHNTDVLGHCGAPAMP